MTDSFFNQRNCDRCGGELRSRIMSWFTNETICISCANKESDMKSKLRELGRGDMEGCGYIPKMELIDSE